MRFPFSVNCSMVLVLSVLSFVRDADTHRNTGGVENAWGSAQEPGEALAFSLHPIGLLAPSE